jgi:hypothetical protein
MNSLIETQRSLHEEIELLEDTLVSSLCEDYTKKSVVVYNNFFYIS